MKDKLFIDSNISIYALADNSFKQDTAINILQQRPFISSQVVMETINILIKKFKYPKEIAFESGINLINNSILKEISQYTLVKAFEISLKYNFSHWDSLIIASAIEANCTLLYSEDLQHGQIIENQLNIVNPFL